MSSTRLRHTALMLVSLSIFAQSPAPTPQAPVGPNGQGAAPRPAVLADTEPKPYDKIITSEFKTQAGLFKVHQHKGKLYFEIPKADLGKELLLVATAVKTPSGVDHAGKEVNDDVVRWILKENKVFLTQVSHAVVSDPAKPIAAAVANSNQDAILMSFPVEAFAKDGSPVIEVSKLFTNEVGEFSARALLSALTVDVSRSFVEQAKAFPGNVQVDAVQTYTMSAFPPGTPVIPGMPSLPPKSGSVKVAYSFVALPEKPMMPRLMDDRVGYFSVRNVDYGRDEHEAKRRSYITRWKLEKKDPNAALSEPIKPIVWYIDSATPTQWVPYIKKGVEAWNVAFEAAGFKNAVQARSFPTKEQDPQFDPADMRYSIIRWVPSPIANAYGPHISDPRSGEILNADIIMYHNILQLQRDWYFTQVGPLDPRAQTLPLPDDLMGELVAYVVTHECGHSLGFPHNMKSSSEYPLEKIRDKEWLAKMGHVATLMDYCRFNYVAQPEDRIDPKLLIPKIGPYDTFAVQWGYTPIKDAKTPDEEKAALDAWALRQDKEPWLRFSTPGAFGSDPGENTEAVGDADAVAATALGTKNLQRVADMLLKVSEKPGDDLETLSHLYTATWGQWTRELNHVAVIVGGYDAQTKHGGQSGAVFTPVSKTRQQQAVKYLNAAILQTPDWLLKPEILSRIEPNSGSARLLGAQKSVLRNLMDRSRLGRLQEQESAQGDKAYKLGELLADLRSGIFTELSSTKPNIDAHRRDLQRAYLELLNERINQAAPAASIFSGRGLPSPNSQDDQRGAIRAELKSLQAQLSARLPTAKGASKAHLEDLKDQITKILDPRFAATSSPSANPFSRTGAHDEDTCWPAIDTVFE
ncbi:MAG: zinc-dependent metalloprotease [Holophagaceae bacterium]|nr:zinc-dependent metalloprotease [Holophagaceae bacterium]